ncbi:granzyme B(G,H)-like [Clytia hemisphaerica]|uniref:Peptidase S1 domain-containing protein n=1 Tax=Clytia hemisphaerica TaxID=252671 RepID=A0A7M5VER5_9CNID
MIRIFLLVVFLAIASDIQGRVQEKHIIHGTESKPGAWPWVVSVQIRSQDICGGTILSKTWIMTAAHCFNHKPAASDITVVAGAHNIKIHEDSQQTITAKRYVLNPGYNPNSNVADIALIELSTPLKFNKRVEQARIQAKDEYPSLEKTCFIAGWGQTSQAHIDPVVFPDTLQEAQLPIIKERNKKYIYAGFNDGDEKPNACYGDSGGPLMCKTTFLRRWVVQGPMSHVFPACSFETAVIPVAKYLSWVKEYVKDLKTQN